MITIINNLFVKVPGHKETFIIHEEHESFDCINIDGKIVTTNDVVYIDDEVALKELGKNAALKSLAFEYDLITEDDFDIMEFINYE